MGTWTKPFHTVDSPCPRYCHSCTRVGDDMYVLAGYNGDYLNDTYVFQTDLLSWRQIECKGDKPEARYGHSATCVGKSIVLFGGRGSHNRFNDVYVLDVEERSWRKQKVVGRPPGARSGHTATLIGTHLYILFGIHGSYCLSDLQLLDTQDFQWTKKRPLGKFPVGRFGHTSTLWHAEIVVFGGRSDTEWFNDVNMLDTKRNTWYPVLTRGRSPAPRSGHSADVVSNSLIVFGGANSSRDFDTVHVLDLNKHTWSAPRLQGTSPAPRNGHTSVLHKDRILVFGGSRLGTYCNDTILLQLPTADRLRALSPRATSPNDRPSSPYDQGATSRNASPSYSIVGTTADMRGLTATDAATNALIESSLQKLHAQDAHRANLEKSIEDILSLKEGGENLDMMSPLIERLGLFKLALGAWSVGSDELSQRLSAIVRLRDSPTIRTPSPHGSPAKTSRASSPILSEDRVLRESPSRNLLASATRTRDELSENAHLLSPSQLVRVNAHAESLAYNGDRRTQIEERLQDIQRIVEEARAAPGPVNRRRSPPVVEDTPPSHVEQEQEDVKKQYSTLCREQVVEYDDYMTN